MDMVDYLATLGHHPVPKYSRHPNYWYISPLRNERTPSFKVNRKLNVWYDHGTGEGGNLIDFGIRYHRCTVTELLRILEGQIPWLSFHQPIPQGPQNPPGHSSSIAGEKKKDDFSQIVILAVRPLEDKALLSYLQSRNIPIRTAQKYCCEIDFTLYRKTHTVIGFKNNSGGYELRSRFFKGASAPKDITHIKSDTPQPGIHVLEGFTDFLSLLTLQNDGQVQTDYLVLNSLSFVNKSIELLKPYNDIFLFLDRNTAGIKATAALKAQLPQACDASILYKDYEDLNDYLNQKPAIRTQAENQPGKKRRPRL